MRTKKKKISKEDQIQKQGEKEFKAWMRDNKKLEEQGLYGPDWFVKRVEELEAKVKRLEARLKKKEKK